MKLWGNSALVVGGIDATEHGYECCEVSENFTLLKSGHRV